jgi:hypothetical protein
MRIHLPHSRRVRGWAALLVFVIAPITLTGAACGENKPATEQCKDAKNGDACNTCCKDNGAQNYAFVSGAGCTCRG